MAPEQARGHAVNKWADIGSFDAVLYEVLSGGRAFPGETTSDLLVAVLQSDPDWSALPASTSPSIVRLLRRCLIKDRKQRLQAKYPLWVPPSGGGREVPWRPVLLPWMPAPMALPPPELGLISLA